METLEERDSRLRHHALAKDLTALEEGLFRLAKACESQRDIIRNNPGPGFSAELKDLQEWVDDLHAAIRVF